MSISLKNRGLLNARLFDVNPNETANVQNTANFNGINYFAINILKGFNLSL